MAARKYVPLHVFLINIDPLGSRCHPELYFLYSLSIRLLQCKVFKLNYFARWQRVLCDVTYFCYSDWALYWVRYRLFHLHTTIRSRDIKIQIFLKMAAVIKWRHVFLLLPLNALPLVIHVIEVAFARHKYNLKLCICGETANVVNFRDITSFVMMMTLLSASSSETRHPSKFLPRNSYLVLMWIITSRNLGHHFKDALCNYWGCCNKVRSRSVSQI